MRPKRNVIVMTARPELRFGLRIFGRFNILAAKSIEQVSLDDEIDLAIIDKRDQPGMAEEEITYLRAAVPRLQIIALAGRVPDRICAEFIDDVLYDGAGFFERLLWSVKLAVARKRGPRKGSQRAICQ